MKNAVEYEIELRRGQASDALDELRMELISSYAVQKD